MKSEPLELSISTQPSSTLVNQSNAKAVAKHLRQLSRWCCQVLTIQQTLQITQRSCPQGTPPWHVYDPTTQTHRWFWSEAEVRYWLDTRHLG
jgi:hypothetical protein